MIDTGLDKKFTAKEDTGEQSGGFELLPEGDYNVVVSEISTWKENKKDIQVNKRDKSGQLLRDASGKIVKEFVKGVVYYNSNVKLKVAGGPYNGRVLFTTLTTHPNASFITENFLFAIGEEEMIASEIPTKALNKPLVVTVYVDEYTKKFNDPETGLPKEVVKTKNAINAFKKSELVESNDTEEYDV